MIFRNIRNKAKLTQSVLAELMSVSQVTVSQWESGKSYPHASKLPALADILNATEREIIHAIAESSKQR